MKFTEQLMELPLFQGMSFADINEVMAHAKLGFHKVAQGKTVVSEGDVSEPLHLLVKGTLTVSSIADDHSYTVVETMAAPAILQPECFFGLSQRFTKTFVAQTECHFIRLEKVEVMRLSTDYEVFRINLLNIISAQSQRIGRLPWRVPPKGLRNKIARFIEDRCMRPAGRKELFIRMEDMARMIGESRLNLSNELKRMHQEGLIDMGRGHIVVHAIEKLRN